MGFTIQEYDLRNTFATERTLLTLSGFYPRRNQGYNIFFTISAGFNVFVAYGELFSMVAQMIVDRKDLTKLTETLLFFMTHFTFLCKLSNFINYKKKMFDIEDHLTKSIFYGFPHHQLHHIKNRIASCTLVAKIFRILCVLVIFFYTLVPYLDEQKQKTLPLPGWLPYDTDKYYYPTVVFQVSSVCVSAYNNSTIDILTCMLLTLATAEFEILEENLKNINYRTDEERGNVQIENDLKFCIKHHKEIVSLVFKVEDMFSKGVFLQFFASIVVICFTGFQMIVVPIPSVQFIFLVVYFSCMMCQVAMYCWYGHEVMTTSDKIGQYFYMSNWYEADLRIRRIMYIFLEKTKKPCIVTAGKFVTLSLGTLTADYDFRNTFKLERKLLNLSGFYPQRTKTSIKYRLSALFNILMISSQLFSMIGQMIIDRKNLSKLTEVLLIFITHCTFLSKLSNFVYFRKNLLLIEDFLAEPVFYGFSFDKLNLVKNKIDNCKLIAKLFRAGCVLTITFYALIPYLGESRNLPMPAWMPYNVTEHFHVTVAYEILVTCVSAYNNSSMDILTWILITLASAQFDILKENLKNIDYNTSSDGENVEIYFKKCIKHHAAIINLVNKTEALFSKGMFLQFFASVVVICFTGFQLMVVPIMSIQFACFITYFVCMMSQVAMYCWYGHDVMTTSDEIGRYFYMSNWYESDIKMRKSIFIFLESTKKPVVITAGKLVVLSLITFSAILRSSYSYFAVLQHLYTDS